MGKKEGNPPKTDESADELSKDLEDVDEKEVVDEIPDEVLLNEPLDDDDLTTDLDTITSGKKPKKLQKKQQKTPFLQQTARKTVKAQQPATLEGPDADDDILAEMEGILSGKAPLQKSSKIKTNVPLSRVIHSSIYIHIIQAVLFLEICILGAYYIPSTLLIEGFGEKLVFFALHLVIGMIIITGGILYFRSPRIAVLFSFIGTLWTGLAWMILYFWIGFPYVIGWWAFPLLCVAISGVLIYFTIQCVLNDPCFGE